MNRFGLVLFGFVLGATVMFFAMPEISFEPHTIDLGRSVTPSSSAAPVLAGVPFMVVHVVDGDTIDVAPPGGDNERVRLIGIDTPETVDPRKSVQCFGPEASARMKALLEGKTVLLQSKPDEDKDNYGRLLRYVSLDGEDIGAQMIREGYAQSICNRYPHPRCELYEEFQEKATTMHLGRWSACTK